MNVIIDWWIPHTASELSIRFNSMYQPFWSQNIKIYHKKIKKMPLCKIFLCTRSHLPASQHQFLDDTKIKITSKNWCWLAGKCFMYARRFCKVAFFIIFMIYFNILGSKVLVHWIEPIARFGRSVIKDQKHYLLMSNGNYHFTFI